MRTVVVIGAGASGCMAAVSAALRGDRVILLEANEKIGKKIFATGNGRCNLTNLFRSPECYHAGGEDLSPFFERFDERALIAFWEEHGVYLHDRQGYVYPRTDQAATVAEGFGKILRDLGVEIRTEWNAAAIVRLKDSRFLLIAEDSENRGSKEKLYSEKVILACGGLAGPQYGRTGDGYRFAKQFGHTVRKPLPALVPLFAVKKESVSVAAGVRCDAEIKLTVNGQPAGSERGELQITKEGLSGIPVFQISGSVAEALNAGKKVAVRIDFLPDLSEEVWKTEKKRRMSENRDQMLGTLFLGLVNRKVLDLILRNRNLQAEKKAKRLTDRELDTILNDLRDYRVEICGTGDFRQAQVTSGGVPLTELDENLQSRYQPGLYMAGELLDVDGICGGYNLQWAMTSGWVAGNG